MPSDGIILKERNHKWIYELLMVKRMSPKNCLFGSIMDNSGKLGSFCFLLFTKICLLFYINNFIIRWYQKEELE